MITVSVNNQLKTVPAASSVSQALSLWDYRGEKIAVAINGEFVPRSRYEQHQLLADDCIDIVTPVQGG